MYRMNESSTGHLVVIDDNDNLLRLITLTGIVRFVQGKSQLNNENSELTNHRQAS